MFLKNETLNKTREVQKANIFEIHKDRSEFQNLNHAYVPEKPNKITSQSVSQFLEILVKKKTKTKKSESEQFIGYGEEDN